jgi:UDP-N-acetyl-D-glucosamine dehydrogenase
MALLAKRGAHLSYHDPFVRQLRKTRNYDFSGLASEELTPEVLASHDVVVITTDHTGVDYSQVVEHASLVVDTRNATRNVSSGRDKIVNA